MKHEIHEWWQHGVIYQIYPRSFQDTNGDGIGDLQGILLRLDYLKWLGVDAIWISPVYPSPMADFGYDVSNYKDIEPIFGNLTQFDQLVAEAHLRGLKIILDFVPNHTSDEHPWFVESRSSRNSDKRDWYIWRESSLDGGPPNNWLSSFGGSAWTYDDQTDQYYHHHFLAKQPDLNWRNPQVVEAMLDAMRFWLERGVDGFRLDVIWLIIKDDQFRDNPVNPNFLSNEPPHHRLLATYTTDRPEVYEIISRMRQLLDSYDQRMMVGEIYLPIERLMTYYGSKGDGVHLPFNFQLISIEWKARAIAKAVGEYESALPPYGWPNWVLGNHDQPRLASRIGIHQARVAAMLLLTLRGTPTLYYGDEIGMTNVPIPPEKVQDPFEKNVPGIGVGRDPQRTPMQWDDSENAGFSQSLPWLPVSSCARLTNVETQRQAKDSMLSFYRELLQLRRKSPALSIGTYSFSFADDHVYSFIRRHNEEQFQIVLNFSDQPTTVEPPIELAGQIDLSTQLDRYGERVSSRIDLNPNEGIIIRSSR